VDELSALLDARGASHASALARDERATLMDVVFFSSMHEEEGAHVVYDAVVLSRLEARRSGLEAFEFAQTIALEPRRLAKLSSAALAVRARARSAERRARWRYGVSLLARRVDDLGGGRGAEDPRSCSP
jgi:hypothetical protein